MATFVGKYKLSKSDNFDEFLKELGLGMIKRTAARASTPEVEVSVEGDQYTIKTRALKNSEIKFKLGEEFTEDRQDGVTVKTVITQDGNKLIQKQMGDKEVNIVREFTESGITTTATVNGVTSIRTYDRL